MSVRNAWQRITEDYRKNKERTGRRKAYEEMIYTENQMKIKRQSRSVMKSMDPVWIVCVS